MGHCLAWLQEHGIEPPRPLADALARADGPGVRELSALETAARMILWISAADTREVERTTGWSSGMLARAGEGLAWLASATGALSRLAGSPVREGEAWDRLAARLRIGLPPAASSLAALWRPSLGRATALLLCREGLADPAVLGAADPDYLTGLLEDARLAAMLQAGARHVLSGEPHPVTPADRKSVV